MNIERNCTRECTHSEACDIDFGKRLAAEYADADGGSAGSVEEQLAATQDTIDLMRALRASLRKR